MQVCVLYAGRTRDGGKLPALAKAVAKGIEFQGHQVDVINMYEEGVRLTIYDYVVIGSEPVSFFSAQVPSQIAKFLAQAGTVSGKRCFAFISGGLRKGRTLQNLMKAMEHEGMYLRLSDIISKEDAAIAIGKRLNVERN